MPTPRRTRIASRLRDDLVLRTVTYYVLLAGGVALLWRFVPSSVSTVLLAPLEESATGTFLSRRDAAESLAIAGTPGRLFPALIVFLAMGSAAMLALPVAWLYILTRQKKGYRQSVVQTLVLLPVVVAGVVVLVKNSLALAFSLAGIVAAVRFRNTLEDSKDAVYLFLATAVGLASGVQLPVAVALSVGFNLLILGLWRSEFGSTPAHLEGRDASRRMERALAIANRTGMFVARVDDEILKAMAPAQLDALADRAWRRRKRAEQDADAERPAFDSLLRIRTAEVDRVRTAVEAVLDDQLKRWRYGGVIHEDDGTHVIEYSCQMRKSATPEALLEALRARGGEDVLDARLV